MKTLEFSITYPESFELCPQHKSKLEALLVSSASDEEKTKTVQGFSIDGLVSEYETQDEYGVPFRTNGLWHVDSTGSPHTISTYTTSTPTVFAEGTLRIHEAIVGLETGKDDIIVQDFNAGRGTVLFMSLLVMGEVFEDNWLEILYSHKDHPKYKKIEKYVQIDKEFKITQLPPYTIYKGSPETLHKASPRLYGEPRARIFGHKAYYR